MTPRKQLLFILQAITAGLAIAFRAMLLFPDLRIPARTVVEVRENGSGPTRTISERFGGGPVSYADAVKKAAPAVVNIHTSKVITTRVHPLLKDPVFRHFFGDRFSKQEKRMQSSLGSGVIFSTQGYVLTNNHVIDQADEIQVMLNDGRSATATVVGTDPETDLAVLSMKLDKLPSVVIGRSESLEVGDVVLAIGNPFGVGQTVTQGIVSATGRDQLGISAFENFLQTDAAINPGNSGGALINAAGELVGINTAIFSKSGGSQGIGFAIPVALARGVLKQILEHGFVVRGWLGIEAQDLTPALAKSFDLEQSRGLLIAGVLQGGPADTAGLLPGDVVTAIDDIDMPDSRDAMNYIAGKPPGTVIRISGFRAGKKFRSEASVGRRPPQQNGPARE